MTTEFKQPENIYDVLDSDEQLVAQIFFEEVLEKEKDKLLDLLVRKYKIIKAQ